MARRGGCFTLRWFSGWNHSPGWLFAAQLAAAGALLTLSQASDPACYFILLPVLGIFSSLSYSLSFFYGLTTPSRAGKNSGLHEAVLSLGLMTGPLVCGAAANALPDWPAVALAVAGGALLLALTVELTIMKIYRGRKEPGC